MSRGIQQFSIFIILFLLGCAVQGPVTGGQADEKGPTLITVQPGNASLNISQEQKIILTFDELLDPVSVVASIQLEFDREFLVYNPDQILIELTPLRKRGQATHQK
jgi:hypothetical protein